MVEVNSLQQKEETKCRLNARNGHHPFLPKFEKEETDLLAPHTVAREPAPTDCSFLYDCGAKEDA